MGNGGLYFTLGSYKVPTRFLGSSKIELLVSIYYHCTGLILLVMETKLSVITRQKKQITDSGILQI